ncbi:hypothetical protein CHUAL_007949 [Chamberlinius hualienensis]
MKLLLTIFVTMTISLSLTTGFELSAVGDPIALNDVSSVQPMGGFNLTSSFITGLDQPANINTDDVKNETTLNFSYLNVTGHYWTDGNLFYFFPLFGEGNYNFQAVDVTVTATGEYGNYDMFFYASDYKCFLENYLGGGVMTLVGDALRLPPIVAEAFFQSLQPNIIDILNEMVINNTFA